MIAKEFFIHLPDILFFSHLCFKYLMETDLILFLIELYGVAGWLVSSSFDGDPADFFVQPEIKLSIN